MNLDNKTIGISNFKGYIEPIEAVLFEKPEDFIVEELHENSVSNVGYTSEEKDRDNSVKAKKGKYVYASLVKKEISTFNAVDKIASELGIDKNDVGTCGLKDTTGYTSQYISIKGCSIEEIKKIKNNNFFLKDFKYGDRPFVIRGHKGNRFTIKARGIKENEKSIKEKMNILRERLSKGIPNFYDQQRFGKRQNNHFIGREMVKRNFKEAVRKLLTDTNGESPETEKFRKFVSENWGNWKKCLEKSREVKCLDYETDVIYYLTENKDDYLGSLKSIPLGKFFLSSYMSYLFNQALSEIISQGRNVENLEKLGFDAVLSEETRPIYEKILKKGGIKLSDFKIDDEMFLQYGVKPTKFFPENFDFEISGNDLTVKFDLGIGNYATMVLRLIFSDINKLD